MEVLREVGKLTGEIRELAPGGVTINNNLAIMNSPAIAEMQAAIIRVLAPYPEARAAVVAALRRHEGVTAPPLIEAVVKPAMAIECEAIDVAAE